MAGKYARKKAIKLATSRQVAEKQRRVSGEARRLKEQVPLDGARRMSGNLVLSEREPAGGSSGVNEEQSRAATVYQIANHQHNWNEINGKPNDLVRTNDLNDYATKNWVDNNYRPSSVSFKRDLKLDKQLEFMRLLHAVEEIDEDYPTLPDFRKMLKLLKALTRLTVDDPDFSAEELMDFLQNGSPGAVEAWYEENHHSRMALRMARDYPETAKVRAHFSRGWRELCDDLGLDIYDISESELQNHPETVIEAIRANADAHSRGVPPPTHF